MRVTLGGDRVGSGKKMKVDLHGFERSTHDLSYTWRSTMAVGTLVPFLNEVALPGDTFDIDLDAYVNTHPTLGPLFGTMKLQLDVYITPIRLYNAWLHNNQLRVGMNMSQILLPRITLPAKDMPENYTDDIDLDNWQINSSCLLKYLGIAGIGNNNGSLSYRTFNATGVVNYWDIYKNYYANKQEEVGAVIHTPYTAIVTTVDFMARFHTGTNTVIPQYPAGGSSVFVLGDQIRLYYTPPTPPEPEQIIIDTVEHGKKTALELSVGVWTNGSDAFGDYIWSAFRQTFWGDTTFKNWDYAPDGATGEPAIATFPLSQIDLMREQILGAGNSSVQITDTTIEPYGWLCQNSDGKNNMEVTMEGLGLKTYQSDIFNNWINTDWIDGTGGITDLTKIDTSSGSFSLDTLNLSRKIYDLLNRVAVGDGSYGAWIGAAYDQESYLKAETPMYIGGLSKEIVFQEVISNSASGEQPLGTLGGKGTLSPDKHKGGSVNVKVTEPAYIMGIVSITPRIDYSQGNRWDTHLITVDDLHKPNLDEIGFQETSTEQIAWWDTKFDGIGKWEQKSMGKQPAWINYMTNYNRAYGNFAVRDNEMFMTLNRRYETKNNTLWQIADLTTYIHPNKFNFIFAETALDAQNFWVQIGVGMEVRRKMSAKVMPML